MFLCSFVFRTVWRKKGVGKMKKILLLTLLGVLYITTAHAGVSYVDLADVPTTYTAATETFQIDGSGLVATVVYDDGTPQFPISPASFNLTTSYDSGMLFTGGTLLLTGEDGTLISGDVISILFEEAHGWLVGKGTATVSESSIDGFPTGPSEIISLTFKLDPDFTDFSQDYSGLSKVNLGVPEPATMGLLALGGLLLRRKR